MIMAFAPFSLATANPCGAHDASYPGPYAIYFDAGSSTLKASDKTLLKQVAAEAKELLVQQICIIGRSGQKGSAAYNNKLSLSRAETVRNYLSREGVMHNRIVILREVGPSPSGFGYFFTSDAGEDRRVDVIFAR